LEREPKRAALAQTLEFELDGSEREDVHGKTENETDARN
jgi:hypothetical protein